MKKLLIVILIFTIEKGCSDHWTNPILKQQSIIFLKKQLHQD